MKLKYLVVSVAVVAGALGMSVLTTAAADAQIEVTVNGSVVDIAPDPIIQGGRVFVPLRGVFEQLGASVVYSNGTINATGNGRTISLQIGSTQATVNDQPQTIDVAPFIVGASTYVPLRFISEALGDSVSWDDANNIAAIDTGGGSATYFSPGTASYVDTAPPPIPVYDQPEVPDPNSIWQPGYWAWGSYGYYWVPGTWVEAPQPNYLWTPGYWQSNNGGYNWNPGYWAVAIGFYGGVNYGGGYFGHGYDGGQWSNNQFRYNTYVTHVNTTNIRNVYIDRSVYVNNSTTRISYNGGQGGLAARPTTQQLAVARGRHVGMTVVQRQHVQQAEQDRRLLASVNNNRPAVLAVARPLSTANRPAGFVPVRTADRVNPQANVAPVHVAPRPAAPARAGRAPTQVPAAAHSAPAVHAPVPVPGAPAARRPGATLVAPAARAPAANVAPVSHEHAVRPAPAAVHEAPPAHVAPVPAAHVAPVPAAHVAPVPAAHVAPVPAARVAPVPAAIHAPAVHAAPAAVHAAPPAAVARPVHAAAAAHPAPPHAAGPPHAAPGRPAGPGEHKPPQ